MGYTTYLLGAGASANAIPTYFSKENNFTAKFIDFIFEHFGKFRENNIVTDENIFRLIVEIREEGSRHYTIDTYARKLFLSNNQTNIVKLKILKILLSNFLEFCQIPKTNQKEIDVVDYRYDVLLSSILEKSKEHPKLENNIRFISWNYDNQLEMALLNFNDQEWSIDDIMEKYNYYPRKGILNTNDSEQTIVKLNGLAGKFYIQNKENKEITNLDREAGEINIENRLRIAFLTIDETEYLINFAWEHQTNDISQQAIKYTKEIFKNTEKLIVIGYSFPGYNHDIDMDLFSSLKYPAKILYQSGDKNSVNEIRKIKSLFKRNDREAAKIEHTDYCDNFILPHQFDQYF